MSGYTRVFAPLIDAYKDPKGDSEWTKVEFETAMIRMAYVWGRSSLSEAVLQGRIMEFK